MQRRRPRLRPASFSSVHPCCRSHPHARPDGKGAPAGGAAGVPTTVIQMKPVQATFVRVTQTGSARDGEDRAIQQVRMYEAIKR